MRVILRSNLSKKGKIGEIVTVSRGYYRNYLGPQGKAVLANSENEAIVQQEKVALEKLEKANIKKAELRAKPFSSITLTLKVNVNQDGKLFGAIYATDIIDALKDLHDLELMKHEIDLPKGPIRTLGEHQVKLNFHDDIQSLLSVCVEADSENADAEGIEDTIRALDDANQAAVNEPSDTDTPSESEKNQAAETEESDQADKAEKSKASDTPKE
jgi:large subunit ribosomal protein L9